MRINSISAPYVNVFHFQEMGNRLSEVGKDITELKTLSGSGVEVVRGELDERLNKAEKRVVDIEEAFAGLKERLEEVRTQLLRSVQDLLGIV